VKTEEEETREYSNWKSDCRVRGYFWKVERVDIINHLIKKFNYVNYLEIGVNNGDCIRKITAKHKDGVDPGVECPNPPEVNYPMTSDDFFKLIHPDDIKYDIIFIDGLHHGTQVYKDIKNALNYITDQGTIVCHDMNPQWEITQRKHAVVPCWNGDCWKAWAQLRSELTNYNMQVVDTDHGVGIIRKGKQECISLPKDELDLDFWYLDSNRKELLNLITVDEFERI
jgi:hypothetical protein